MLNYKQTLEKDFYSSERVSFNYPKYEKIGTPHDIWLDSVHKVEEFIEAIIKEQPYPDEYPVGYTKEEENDKSGKVIRVHYDFYGKSYLVKYAIGILSFAEDLYVATNISCSDKAAELKKSMPAGMSSLTNPQATEVIHTSSIENIEELIVSALKSKGYNTDNMKIVKQDEISQKEVQSLLPEEDDDSSDKIDDILSGSDELMGMPLIMPMQDDDFN